MTDSNEFAPNTPEPFTLFDAWMREAEGAEINDASAAALATVSEAGWPSVRVVLIKGRDAESVHFFTNYKSRKADELAANPRAALNFHWKSLRRQVRMVGRVERLDAAQSDAYFASRPYGSRIGAWASKQSQILAGRDALMARVRELEAKHPENPPRPDFWGGYRLIPHEIEFWQDSTSRLHDRFRYDLDENGWCVVRLYP